MNVDHSVALFQSSTPLAMRTSAQNDLLLREQTDQFEAYFLKQILDIAMKNESGLFPKDAGDKIYQSMYNDTMGTALSGNLGISEMLFTFLKEGR